MRIQSQKEKKVHLFIIIKMEFIYTLALQTDDTLLHSRPDVDTPMVIIISVLIYIENLQKIHPTTMMEYLQHLITKGD